MRDVTLSNERGKYGIPPYLASFFSCPGFFFFFPALHTPLPPPPSHASRLTPHAFCLHFSLFSDRREGGRSTSYECTFSTVAAYATVLFADAKWGKSGQCAP